MKTFTKWSDFTKYILDNNLEVTSKQWEIVEVRNTYTKESKWILILKEEEWK